VYRRSGEKRPETRLLEMTIAGEGVGQAAVEEVVGG
jgi:hypothetical protein